MIDGSWEIDKEFPITDDEFLSVWNAIKSVFPGAEINAPNKPDSVGEIRVTSWMRLQIVAVKNPFDICVAIKKIRDDRIVLYRGQDIMYKGSSTYQKLIEGRSYTYLIERRLFTEHTLSKIYHVIHDLKFEIQEFS